MDTVKTKDIPTEIRRLEHDAMIRHQKLVSAARQELEEAGAYGSPHATGASPYGTSHAEADSHESLRPRMLWEMLPTRDAFERELAALEVELRPWETEVARPEEPHYLPRSM